MFRAAGWDSGPVVDQDRYTDAVVTVLFVFEHSAEAVHRSGNDHVVNSYGHMLVICPQTGESGPRMPRPEHCRWIEQLPGQVFFKPRGVPMSQLNTVRITVDEFEALRLADLLGLYQEEAATRMGVSRQTFGRIIESARRKVVSALAEGSALEIAGGTVAVSGERRFLCRDCGGSWSEPRGTGRPDGCPVCGSGVFGRQQDRSEASSATQPEPGCGCRVRGGKGCRCGKR